MQKYISITLVAALFAFASGCSDDALKTYPVTGTVTYKGEPLVGATVGFAPKTAGQGDGGFARTDSKGGYKLQTTQGRVDAGTTPGEYYVTISKVEMTGTGKYVVDSTGERREEERPVSVIPEKYSSAEGELTATVEKKNNVFNFDLTD